MIYKTIGNYFQVGLCLVVWGACQNQPQTSNLRDIKEIAQAYYKVYQDRSDFEAFLDFYEEDLVLEDMVMGEKIFGKQSFAEFFAWENPEFKKLDSLTLVLEEQYVVGNTVISQGYFNPFQWGDAQFEAMQFTTILSFNAQGKIIKQVDWINYPNNLLDYSQRKNSNHCLKRD